LNASEIADHYNGGTGKVYCTTQTIPISSSSKFSYARGSSNLTIDTDGSNVLLGNSSNLMQFNIPDNKLYVSNLAVTGNTSEISIWAQAGISATNYTTRTSVYDTTKGSALNYIQDASYYLNKDGSINHTKFYGFTAYSTGVVDYSKFVSVKETEKNCTWTPPIYDSHDVPIVPAKLISCSDINVTKIVHPYKTEEGINLNSEIDVLRQAVYELKTENTAIKKSLCDLGQKQWC
jgi:hypothetical protein